MEETQQKGVTVRFPYDLWKRLKQLALDKDQTVTEIILSSVEKHVNREAVKRG